MKQLITIAICYMLIAITNYNICSAGEPFESISTAKHIFGTKVTKNDLRGKVVFLEYWGINCPPCRASFPHLVKLQKKYGKTNKFTVLASHCQGFSSKVTIFLKKNGVTFPVYQSFSEPLAPPQRRVPAAALFDHKGRVVATGRPENLYSKVAALVKAAPKPPHPILGSVKIKYCKSQASILGSGRSIASTMNNLKKLSLIDNDKGREAKELLHSAENYLAQKQDQLIKDASEEPSIALPEMIKFSNIVRDMEYNKKVTAKIIELKKDNSLKKLIRLKLQLDKLNKKLEKQESKSTRKALENVKLNIQKLIDDKNSSSAVINEAKELIK